jgi:predicted ATPase
LRFACDIRFAMALLEREREIAALQAMVDDVSRRRGGCLVLEGATGAGKSALLAELVGGAQDAGVQVSSVRATRLGAEIAFGLARRLLEPLVRATPAALSQAGRGRRVRYSKESWTGSASRSR